LGGLDDQEKTQRSIEISDIAEKKKRKAKEKSTERKRDVIVMSAAGSQAKTGPKLNILQSILVQKMEDRRGKQGRIPARVEFWASMGI